MFGEYMVYINDKPILLVCNNTVYVKALPCLDEFMPGAEKACGYGNGSAKNHYVLDVDNKDLAFAVISTLEKTTAIPKPRKKAK